MSQQSKDKKRLVDALLAPDPSFPYPVKIPNRSVVWEGRWRRPQPHAWLVENYPDLKTESSWYGVIDHYHHDDDDNSQAGYQEFITDYDVMDDLDYVYHNTFEGMWVLFKDPEVAMLFKLSI